MEQLLDTQTGADVKFVVGSGDNKEVRKEIREMNFINVPNSD